MKAQKKMKTRPKKPEAALKKEQLENMEAIKAMGINPFGGRFERTHSMAGLLEKYSGMETGEKVDAKIRVAGRIRSVRRHGKLTFAHIEDESGRMQVYVDHEESGKKACTLLEKLGAGDIIGVEGGMIKTKRGELSVNLKKLTLLTKALLPVPAERFGLKDVETRYRQRYLDMMVNPDVRKLLTTRSRIITAIRDFLNRKGFIEFETPILQPIAGGATARPFVTFHNTLNADFYLRISPELYLKRLIVGGFDKVYDIGKSFRNEGIDTRHNPEFTMVELYWAYADYTDNMKLTEEMMSEIAKKVTGSAKVEYQGQVIDLSPPWKRISMLDAIKEYAGIDVKGKDVTALRKECRKLKLDVVERATKGEIIEALFEELVQPKLIQPTFVTDHPVDVSPLAKQKTGSPELTERYELMICGIEFANAYSELADPIDQKNRFIEQIKKREKGDTEAHMMDEDFIRALEYGMPPTSGNGIGIDRFIMLLTNSPSMRDVIPFPTLRAKKGDVFGDEVKDTIINRP